MTNFERKVMEAAQEHLRHQEYGPAESGVFEFVRAIRELVGEEYAKVCDKAAGDAIDMQDGPHDSRENLIARGRHAQATELAARFRALTKGEE